MQDKRKHTPPPFLPNGGDSPPEPPSPPPLASQGDDWPAPFRASALLLLPRDLASGLRRVGRAFALEALEHFGIAPDSPPESQGGPPILGEMLAAAAVDLRHVEAFLRLEIARAAESDDPLTSGDLSAARLASVLAPRVGTLAAALEGRVG